MMKQFIFTGALVLASAMTGEAMASCSINRVNTVTDLETVLSGNTMCVPAITPPSGTPWTKQEEHFAPSASGGVGQLWDYKLGTGHPVDQRRQLGTWQVSGSPGLPVSTTVTYNYTAWVPNSSETYQVYHTSPDALGAAGSIYEFCTTAGGTPSATGKLKLGTGAGCP